MESGYAFLHPRNAFVSPSSISIDTEYASIPFSPWRPCIPFIERHCPAVGWQPLLLRWARVTWVFVTLPTWLGFALIMHSLPPSYTRSIGYAIWPRRKTWTLWQGLTYPVLARLVWAITFGLPPAASPVTKRGIPPLAKLWYGRGTTMEPVDLAFGSKDEENRWIKEEAIDPSGKIVPQEYLTGFWINSKTATPPRPSTSSQAARQPAVVLYLVGGGFITGHPLEASRVFDIARMTGIPVLGVNYRKSVTSLRAFPAPLQDTLSAYAYLLRRGYTRIALAGDSAGAGLGLALLQYLSRMVIAEARVEDSQDQQKLVLPVAACFYSPWADLTFSHHYKETVHFDIIHKTMLTVASAAYTSGLERYPDTGDESMGRLQRRHPFFSPALPSAVPSLCRISEAAKILKQPLPSFLIVTGTAELFSAECDSLCYNLRKAGLPVEELNVEDEVHGPTLMPSFMSPKIRPTLDRVRDFLLQQ